MSCTTDARHEHTHGTGCGHQGIEHEGHVDYLHDGHLHHVESGRVDEHRVAVNAGNPADCTPTHACGAHAADHRHDAQCGHPRVPHGNHDDYLVDGHLHHTHGAHCDDHGRIPMR